MFKAVAAKLFGNGRVVSNDAAPDGVEVLVARGNELLDLGKPGQASKCFQQALQLNPQDIGALVKMGRALIEQGRGDEAQAALKQALALDPTAAEACYFLAIDSQERGDIEAAIAHCAHSLKLQPGLIPCRLLLCRLFLESGRHDDAQTLIQAGIALAPEVADFHFQLGKLRTTPQTLDAAVNSYKIALSLRPDFAEALSGLANVLHRMGEFGAAVERYQQALALTSDLPDAHCDLAQALTAQGQLDAAADCYRKALALDSECARAHCDLATVLKMQGKLGSSIEHYRRAVSIKPNSAHALHCLGQALFSGNLFLESIDFLQKAIEIDENCLGAHNTLGVLLKGLNKHNEAAKHFRKVLQLAPGFAEAHVNLGAMLQEQSLHDEAIKNFQEALALKPDSIEAQSGVLFTANYHPDLSAEQVFAAYRKYDQRCGLPFRPKWAEHSNNLDTARRIKVGYVSPDFRQHSVRHFLEPLLVHHDKQRVEVFAYAELSQEDATTARYRSYVDHWVPTLGMTDDALAERIRADGIDVLIDLAGHTADNRLSVFARKPAPVSVSWLGYGYTTGLSAIDYYLTDEVMAPPGSEALFSEQPWRVPTPASVYQPAENMGPVGALPALTRSHVTFGTLTRAVRINHRTIRVWAQILKRLPSSRLRLDSKSFVEVDTGAALAAKFAEHGIAPDRLEFGCHSPPWDVLRGMDIGLDCFPHNSGTTLFEHLYMGVPYVTLADRPSVGRLGSSILKGVGHPEWIAKTEDEYVEIAVALASDLDALADLRSGLRAEMEASPLRDEVGFARKMEAAYQKMFMHWAEPRSNGNSLASPLQASPLQALPLNAHSAEVNYAHAVNSQKRGDTLAAIAYCTQSLELQPSLAPCRLLLCRLFLESGKHEAAKTLIQTGIALTPEAADFHFYLGNLLTAPQTLDAAVESYRAALLLRPDYPEALGGLANALRWQGKFDAAVENYEKAIALHTDYPAVHCSLAATLFAQGKRDAAVACYRKAIEIDPEFALAHCDLGNVLIAQGKFEEALEHFRQVVRIKPTSADALSDLGSVLSVLGRGKEAIECLQKALKLDSRHAMSYQRLGNVLVKLNQYENAAQCYKNALHIEPNYADAHCNLGHVLVLQSQLDQAVERFRTAIGLKPQHLEAQQALLFALNYHPDLNADQVFTAYRDYDQRWGVPLHSQWVEHCNNRVVTRRLKIGYVSPDFRRHSVRHFLEPLLALHDKNSLEVYAYADLAIEDATTARYRASVDHWIPTLGMTDAALTERIRADGIDVLVDLAGHTQNNRLGVFARKPAPVSVSWMGYGYTTGLTAIDYYLTDAAMAPIGSDTLFSERPWRLATPASVYRPAEDMGPVSSLPAKANGHVTFGTLSRPVRINHRTIKVWSQILKRLPGARLQVDQESYTDATVRASLLKQFEAHGISPDQLEIGFHSPPWDVLRGMDIGLDCFPHNSGTTLFETLYMGLPYVTLADRPSVGRLGSSILHGIGHPEWIAKTEDEYVEIAVALASDLDALAALRSGLRAEMEASPLRDEVGFARKMEGAYREMFRRWAEDSTAQ